MELLRFTLIQHEESTGTQCIHVNILDLLQYVKLAYCTQARHCMNGNKSVLKAKIRA